MTLTKQGVSAIERAFLNNEGEHEPFEYSPFKRALELEKIEEEIAQEKKMLATYRVKERPNKRLFKYRNILIKYFNVRGAEYRMLNK